jgi:hypothetical protein
LALPPPRIVRPIYVRMGIIQEGTAGIPSPTEPDDRRET